MSAKTFDPKCWDLAVHFLADVSGATDEDRTGLAREIQGCVEDFIDYRPVRDSVAAHAQPKRECRSCRYWDAHSIDLLKGDCRAPGDHRYSHVRLTSTRPDGSSYTSVAFLDGFGPEETLPGFVCGVWDDGQTASAEGHSVAPPIPAPPPSVQAEAQS